MFCLYANVGAAMQSQETLHNHGTVVDQAIASAYPTTTFTATQMLSMETSVLANQVFTSVVIALAVGFAGFYIGSKLKKT